MEKFRFPCIFSIPFVVELRFENYSSCRMLLKETQQYPCCQRHLQRAGSGVCYD